MRKWCIPVLAIQSSYLIICWLLLYTISCCGLIKWINKLCRKALTIAAVPFFITPPDTGMSKALNCAVNFFTRLLLLVHRTATAHQLYTTGLIVQYNTIEYKTCNAHVTRMLFVGAVMTLTCVGLRWRNTKCEIWLLYLTTMDDTRFWAALVLKRIKVSKNQGYLLRLKDYSVSWPELTKSGPRLWNSLISRCLDSPSPKKRQ